MVFKQLFLSTLTYCISLWGSAPPNLLACLQIYQKNAFRAVLGLASRASVSPRLRYTSLDVSELYRYRLACIPFLSYHSELLFTLIVPHRTAVSARRDKQFDLTVPSFHSELVRLYPLCQIALTWISLPPALKLITLCNGFKRTLNT